jgi:hypothetical protein
LDSQKNYVDVPARGRAGINITKRYAALLLSCCPEVGHKLCGMSGSIALNASKDRSPPEILAMMRRIDLEGPGKRLGRRPEYH